MSTLKKILSRISGLSAFSFGLNWTPTVIDDEKKIDGIVNKYLNIINGVARGHGGVLGLIESGIALIPDYTGFQKVCQKIVLHGKPYPIPKWVNNHFMNDEELFKFIKWQARRKLEAKYYFNEYNFDKLADQYKKEIDQD